MVGLSFPISKRVLLKATTAILEGGSETRSVPHLTPTWHLGNIPQEGITLAPHSCTPGKVALDEDLERILFVVNLGTIAPMENVTIFISTSSELPTLPSGAVRVVLPAICAPTVPQFCTHSSDSFSQQAQG